MQIGIIFFQLKDPNLKERRLGGGEGRKRKRKWNRKRKKEKKEKKKRNKRKNQKGKRKWKKMKEKKKRKKKEKKKNTISALNSAGYKRAIISQTNPNLSSPCSTKLLLHFRTQNGTTTELSWLNTCDP